MAILPTAQIVDLYLFFSTLSKIFEKSMSVRLYSYLEKFELLYKVQYGFCHKQSTSHTLIRFTKYIKMRIDQGDYVCNQFID